MRALLAHPNGDDGVDDGVCHQYRHDRAAFDAAARAMTARHATGEAGQRQGEDGQGGSVAPAALPLPLAVVNGADGGGRLRAAKKRARVGEEGG